MYSNVKGGIYMNYYNQNMIDQLMRQKDKIDSMLNQYSQPPVQNIINTNGVDFEAKELKNGEDVTNILIQRKTLFIDEANKKIYIKEVDGNISKTYDIVVPKDEKDIKIEELENKIKRLEAKVNESNEPVQPTDGEQQHKGFFK